MEHSRRRRTDPGHPHSSRGAGDQPASPHQLVASAPSPSRAGGVSDRNLKSHASQALQERRQNPIALENWSDPGPTHGWGRNGHGHWPHIPCHSCPRKKHHRGPQTTQDQSRALLPERTRKGGLRTPSSVRTGSETSYQQLPSLTGLSPLKMNAALADAGGAPAGAGGVLKAK